METCNCGNMLTTVSCPSQPSILKQLAAICGGHILRKAHRAPEPQPGSPAPGRFDRPLVVSEAAPCSRRAPGHCLRSPISQCPGATGLNEKKGAALPPTTATPRSTARRQPRCATHVGCIGAQPEFTARHGRPIARAAGRNGAATLKRARRGAVGPQWETTALPGFWFAVGHDAPRLTAEGDQPLARAAGRNDAATAKMMGITGRGRSAR